MESLAEFLRRRIKEVEREIAALDERRRNLEAEKSNIQKAASAASVSFSDLEDTDINKNHEGLALEDLWGEFVSEGKKRKRKTIVNLTIKEAVLLVLLDVGKPLIALRILDYIKVIYGVEIERTSLSPQLSRLKDEGLIALHGQDWSLTEIGKLRANEVKRHFERINKLPPP